MFLIDFKFDMCQFLFFIISSKSFTTNLKLCCKSYTSKDRLYTSLVSQHPQKCGFFLATDIHFQTLQPSWRFPCSMTLTPKPWPYKLICVVSVCFNNHITDTQAYQFKMTKFAHIWELMFVFTTRHRVSYSGLKTQSLFWRSWIPARVTTVGTVVCLFVCLVFI